MNFCTFLGHNLSGECRYGRVAETHSDGAGRTHALIYKTCRRCREEVQVCRVYLPQRTVDKERVRRVEILIDKIRYAMDTVTEQEYLKDLLGLFDPASGRLK